jgi:hypothetical protein
MRENFISTFRRSIVAASCLTIMCSCWTEGAKGEEGFPKVQKEVVISNAVLARYCGRGVETAEMEKLAEAYLPEKSLKLLRKMVENVISGEYPLEE